MHQVLFFWYRPHRTIGHHTVYICTRAKGVSSCSLTFLSFFFFQNNQPFFKSTYPAFSEVRKKRIICTYLLTLVKLNASMLCCLIAVVVVVAWRVFHEELGHCPATSFQKPDRTAARLFSNVNMEDRRITRHRQITHLLKSLEASVFLPKVRGNSSSSKAPLEKIPVSG